MRIFGLLILLVFGATYYQVATPVLKQNKVSFSKLQDSHAPTHHECENHEHSENETDDNEKEMEDPLLRLPNQNSHFLTYRLVEFPHKSLVIQGHPFQLYRPPIS
jgi:hypothetical protein